MVDNDGVRDSDVLTHDVDNLTCYKKNEQTICGWTWEVLVRIVLAIVFGLSALLIDPFLRWVEGKRIVLFAISLHFQSATGQIIIIHMLNQRQFTLWLFLA